MELVLPMYDVHPYFSLKHLGKKCTLYLAKYGKHISRICLYQVKRIFGKE